MYEYRVKDNFLPEEEFIALRDYIDAGDFAWFFSPTIISTDIESTPGQFVHTVYTTNVPNSSIYDFLIPILNDRFYISVLLRIKFNLQLRLPEPFYSGFHTDTGEDLEEDVAFKWTTSILHINTNNGYTEFEDGTKVESVKNRLVSFPSTTRHRGVSQTDEQTRIVMNLNYLKNRNRD